MGNMPEERRRRQRAAFAGDNVRCTAQKNPWRLLSQGKSAAMDKAESIHP